MNERKKDGKKGILKVRETWPLFGYEINLEAYLERMLI